MENKQCLTRKPFQVIQVIRSVVRMADKESATVKDASKALNQSTLFAGMKRTAVGLPSLAVKKSKKPASSGSKSWVEAQCRPNTNEANKLQCVNCGKKLSDQNITRNGTPVEHQGVQLHGV